MVSVSARPDPKPAASNLAGGWTRKHSSRDHLTPTEETGAALQAAGRRRKPSEHEVSADKLKRSAPIRNTSRTTQLVDSKRARGMLALYQEYLHGVQSGKHVAGKAVLKLLIKTEWPHLRADQCESLIKWVQEDLPAQRTREALEEERRRADDTYFREIFDALDTDCTSTISLKEFVQLKLTCPALNLPDSRLREIYLTADTDGSGELDFDEFKWLVVQYNLIENCEQIIQKGKENRHVELHRAGLYHGLSPFVSDSKPVDD